MKVHLEALGVSNLRTITKHHWKNRVKAFKELIEGNKRYKKINLEENVEKEVGELGDSFVLRKRADQDKEGAGAREVEEDKPVCKIVTEKKCENDHGAFWCV